MIPIVPIIHISLHWTHSHFRLGPRMTSPGSVSEKTAQAWTESSCRVWQVCISNLFMGRRLVHAKHSEATSLP